MRGLLTSREELKYPATFVWPSLLSSLLFPALLAARPIHSLYSPRLACFVMCCWLASVGVRGRTGSHRAFLYDPPKLARPLHLCRRLSLSGGRSLALMICNPSLGVPSCLAPRRTIGFGTAVVAGTAAQCPQTGRSATTGHARAGSVHEHSSKVHTIVLFTGGKGRGADSFPDAHLGYLGYMSARYYGQVRRVSWAVRLPKKVYQRTITPPPTTPPMPLPGVMACSDRPCRARSRP